MIENEKLKLKLNHLEIQSIKQLKDVVNDSRCWDLRIRHNGKCKMFQVDWLKHIVREVDFD